VVEFLSGRFAAAGLLTCTLILGIYGMGRSLWLDEAWVANSVNAPTLGAMFHYPDWLQTSPPLFLLMARGAIRVFGLSDVSLRMVPLGLALLAVVGMLAVARRVVPPAFAALACAALIFHPTMIEYFRSFKQYSGEVAATTFVLWATVRYLQSPERRQFWWLVGTVVLAMSLSYPTVFLLPGMLWAVRPLRRGLALAAVSAGVLAILYWWFIRPNVSSSLQVYWSVGGRDLGTLALTGLAAVCVVVIAARPRFGIQGRLVIVCALPFLLFAIAEAAGWYPQSPRTSLFLRPCLVLAAVMAGAEISKNWNRLVVESVVVLLAIVMVFLGVRKQFHEGRFQPEEDFAGVVRYLSKNAGPTDIVLVHASMREGFLLYTAMQGWSPPNAVFSDTGWPCCPRGKDARPGSSTEAAVLADLDSKIPREFSGRIWLFHSARPTHWDYTGLDEGEAWQRYFWNRNCRPGPYIRFPNLGISPVICSGNSR